MRSASATCCSSATFWAEGVGFLAHGDKLDRLAGHLAHGEGATATGVAVELGHDDAVKVNTIGKLRDHVDDVLARHGIHDHENLVGTDGLLDGHGLLHHLLVDLQAASGVHDHDVAKAVDSLANGAGRHGHGVLAVATKDRNADLPAEGGELVGRSGSVRVAGGQQRVSPLLLEKVRELGGGRRLTGALQAHEHDHVGRAVLRKGELGVRGAQKRGELVENDLDDVLGGAQRREDVGGEALLLAPGNELLDHAIVDVSLEKGHANLAHREVDVVLGEATLAAELLEGVLETVGERVEHGYIPSPTSARQNSRASKVWRSSMVSPTPMR